jgi:hypothetical protein
LYWTRPATLLLIEQYKKISEGSKMKKKKDMWKEISLYFEQHKYTFTPSQCEGRWKTLIRGLKNVTDHNRKSGNNRKTHPYAEALEFLVKMPNIQPKYVLDSRVSSNDEVVEAEGIFDYIFIQNFN